MERLRDEFGPERLAILSRLTLLDRVIVSIEYPLIAGKGQVADYARDLAGWLLDVERETGSKEVRAAPFAAQCEAGNVRLVAGPWVETFLSELETFPMGAHDDQVDAASGAFTSLVNPTTLARQVPFNLMGR